MMGREALGKLRTKYGSGWRKLKNERVTEGGRGSSNLLGSSG
jgi:hypothetical protein